MTTTTAPTPGTGSADWIAGEAGWRDFVAEVRRLARRNRARPVPLLFLVLLTTALGLFLGYRRVPIYEARIALRLTENDVETGAAPRPVSALREWVSDVALSDGRLIRVIEHHNLYPDKRARGLDQALEALRDALSVEVWRNEFLDDADTGLIGRAARVALSYRHPDPDVAFAVVSELAAATVDEQKRMRRAQVEYATLGLEPAIAAAQEELYRVKTGHRSDSPGSAQGRAGSSSSSSSSSGSAQRSAAPLSLPVTVLPRTDTDTEYWSRRVTELSRQKEQAELTLRAETLDLGLRSDIIDTIQPRRRPFQVDATLVGGVIGLLCGLLLGGVTLKAFDRRIYDADDLRRLGYPVCGALPGYPGDGVGSMTSRVRMTQR